MKKMKLFLACDRDTESVVDIFLAKDYDDAFSRIGYGGVIYVQLTKKDVETIINLWNKIKEQKTK